MGVEEKDFVKNEVCDGKILEVWTNYPNPI